MIRQLLRVRREELARTCYSSTVGFGIVKVNSILPSGTPGRVEIHCFCL